MTKVHSLYIGGHATSPSGEGGHSGLTYLYASKLEDDNNIISAPLTFSENPYSSAIVTMAIFNSDLYVGGYLDEDAYLSKLDNNTKTFGNNLIQIVIGAKKGLILSMTVYNEKLYFVEEQIGVHYYDGNNIVSEFTYKNTDGTVIKNPNIKIITSYKNILYIGGNYKDEQDNINMYVASLGSDNKTFTALSIKGNISGKQKEIGIWSMNVYNDNLYIGGGGVIDSNKKFSTYLGMLNANSFESKSSNSDGIIFAMTGYKDKLYLMCTDGVVTTSDGTTLSSVNTVLQSSSYTDVTIHNGQLYASGGRYQPSVFTLNNNTWTKIPGTPDGSNIMPMMDYQEDVKHADQSGNIIKKKSNNLALMLGLGLGIGIPVLAVLIYFFVKDPLHLLTRSGNSP